MKTPRSREVKFPILKTGRLKSDVLRFSLSHAWVFNYPNWHLLLKAELKVKLHLFLKTWAVFSPLQRVSWKMVLSSVPLLPDLCILKNEAPTQSGCLGYSWEHRVWRYWQRALREDENLLMQVSWELHFSVPAQVVQMGLSGQTASVSSSLSSGFG